MLDATGEDAITRRLTRPLRSSPRSASVRALCVIGSSLRLMALKRAGLFETIQASAGRLDILVNSSGVAEHASLEETTEEHIDRAFGLNVRAMVFTVQHAVRFMGEGGAVVLIGSIAGGMANPGYGSYSASKAAVRAYARTWNADLATRGIRVNTLSPGPTDTPMFDQASDEIRQALSARIPAKRLRNPDEVAAAALFLASSESTYVSGAELVIDGGMSA